MFAKGLSKLRVLEASNFLLGLASENNAGLANSTTHIVHNAWPMSGNRQIDRFEAQFPVIRGLIELCYAPYPAISRTMSFQFISSIAIVGHQPLWTGSVVAKEERVSNDSMLPNGYSDAKYTCERMLDATPGRHAQHFRAMSVRLGQVARASKTGY